MRIAITGVTGFLGRYLVKLFLKRGDTLRCWHRPSSDRSGIEGVEWVEGGLGDERSMKSLVSGCDAVVHAALDRPGQGFRGAEGNLVEFVETNVVGSLRLIEAARSAGVARFVFLSSCAVHDVILGDRALDEAHPCWSRSHYGAHKAAIEALITSLGLGDGYPICALRPTGIYGLAQPVSATRWYDLINRVSRSEPVDCRKGGKEVHASDVARAVEILLSANPSTIAGQAYNCCDRYISEFEVAQLARSNCGARGEIRGATSSPANQIVTAKLQALGMQFGGDSLLKKTVAEIVEAASDRA